MVAPTHEESFNSGAGGSGETIGWGKGKEQLGVTGWKKFAWIYLWKDGAHMEGEIISKKQR